MIEGYSATESSYRASADAPSVVDHIARLCASSFADLCAVYLRVSPGAPVAFSTRVPGQFAALREAPFDDLYAERAREAGVVRLLSEPLVVENNAIGFVVLGSSTPQTLTEITPAIADSVSVILAKAIAQAAQLAHHHRVSERLQRAMLPARLVESSGITFDAAYSPASGEAEVGGDWYDAFDIGNGTIGVSVGDVMGHGLEAAVAMSEMRNALRAAAATHGSPASLLQAVATMVSSQGVGVASAIAGIYDPATNVLRYSCAGHPAPVVVTAAGDAYSLPGGGMLIGIGHEPAASHERTVTLAPGTSVFFYTDGLIENRRDVLMGEEVLLATLEALVREGALDAQHLHARIIGDGPSVDDCATLAIHRAAEDEIPSVERYVFTALPASARLARDSVLSFAIRAGVPRHRLTDVVIASGEAVANAIEHGDRSPGATFTIELAVRDEDFVAIVESRGHWRSAASQPERGRGMHIMRSCTKHLEVASTIDATRLTLVFPAEDDDLR
jgi:anti-sigma regulatory factor (Ser/Thr protein kinase)